MESWMRLATIFASARVVFAAIADGARPDTNLLTLIRELLEPSVSCEKSVSKAKDDKYVYMLCRETRVARSDIAEARDFPKRLM